VESGGGSCLCQLGTIDEPDNNMSFHRRAIFAGLLVLAGLLGPCGAALRVRGQRIFFRTDPRLGG
jgi:hypothetical protein